MMTRFRNVAAALLAAGALTLSVSAHAQLRPGASQEQQQKQAQREERRAEPRLQAAPAPPPQASQPQARRPGAAPQRNEPGAQPQAPRAERPAITGTRQYSTRDPDFVPRPGYRGNDRNWNDHDHRPPRVVHRLPYGYRDYHWNGNRYYYYGGSWYRPYGTSFISIGVPYGLFVTTLPGSYNSFWYGGSRYYYVDHTYYLYEPERRGYVVTRSPYGDDEEQGDTEYGEDLYIYPAQGQSEQKQADDRYECHRWAANETKYDPVEDDYNAEDRKDYLRAMTACLTGRGYTVK